MTEVRLGDKRIPFIYQGDEIIHPAPVKDGLMLWYDFSAMSNNDAQRDVAEDLSGNGNHGTLQNFNFTEESGYDKNKLLFDGVDDILQVPEIDLNPQSMSVVNKGRVYSYDGDTVVDELLELSNINIIEFPENLFNGYIRQESGVVSGNIGHRVTQFELVEPGTFYTVSCKGGLHFSRVAFYDNDKNFIEAIYFSQPEDFVSCKSPANAKYIRVSTGVNSGQSDTRFMKIERGEIATKYNFSPVYLSKLQNMQSLHSPLKNLLLYNRPLTPEEIAHNYAIEKGRFGIE